jgi:transposase InsO family protein
VYLLVFIRNLLVHLAEKILLLQPLNLGGITIEHEGPWSGKKDVELATLDWVHWYNEKRLYGPLGYISPATAERNFYNAELTAKIAAE